MTINGNRRFNYNGKKYYVQNSIDGKGKYFLCLIDERGFLQTLYNICGWEVEYFNTIKDAQRYVRDLDFTLDVL